MDNLWNLTHMLRSYIACDEHHCPTIRERLEHHLLSHHTPDQRAPAPRYRHISPSKSSLKNVNAPVISSDEPTSDVDRGRKSSRKQSYREALETEVHVWAEDLPKYSNPSAENLKQNIVNELIEKINRLKSEANEYDYDTKLSRELTRFLDSLPSTPDKKKQDLALDNLKENLIEKINRLNRHSYSKDSSPDHLSGKNENRKSLKIRNIETSTTPTNEDTNNRINCIATNTSSSIYHINKYLNGPKFHDIHIDNENPVDTQVQQDVSKTPPYNTYASSRLNTNKQNENDVDENFVKEKLIFPWMALVIKKSGGNVEQNDRKVLTEVLFYRVRPLLTKQMNSQTNFKLVLKEEILNFLYDYFKVAVDNNDAYFNKLVESLAINLLIENRKSEPHSGSNSKYSYYCTNPTMTYITQTESHFKPIFYNIVNNALKDNFMSSESIKKDITEILIHDIDRIRFDCHQDFYEDIRLILKCSTNLCDKTIANVINVIVDQLSYVLYDNTGDLNLTQKLDIPPWSHLQSELELCSTPKHSMTYIIQRYSDLMKINETKLNAEERAYKKRISALLATWVKIIPNNPNKADDVMIQKTIINSLTTDIYDQVNLEVPENISLFVNRWLNICDYFDDINNAKSYVNKLMKKTIEIPMPAQKKQLLKNKNGVTALTSYSESSPSFDISNMQTSKIFINEDNEIRKQRVNGFVLDAKNSLVRNYIIDVVQWLRK